MWIIENKKVCFIFEGVGSGGFFLCVLRGS